LEGAIVERAAVTKSSNRYLIALSIGDNISVLRQDKYVKKDSAFLARRYYGIGIANYFYIINKVM